MNPVIWPTHREVERGRHRVQKNLKTREIDTCATSEGFTVTDFYEDALHPIEITVENIV